MRREDSFNMAEDNKSRKRVQIGNRELCEADDKLVEADNEVADLDGNEVADVDGETREEPID